MRFNKVLLLGISLFSLTSCSLSWTFHAPEQMSSSIDAYKSFTIGEDTSLISYNKQNRAINFSTSGGTLINDNYTIQDTFFLSSSGNRINGWMLTPNNIKPKATILHFHGSAGNLVMHYRAISPLVQYGFQVFTFDYSGYGFSEGKATRKNVLKDAYSALAFVRKNRKTNDTKLIIYGQSYGGYLASVVGSNKQNSIDGIVIEGAFSAHKAKANHTIPIIGYLVKNEAIASEEIQKNTKPLLIIHSIEDKSVPLRFGREIFEQANEPKAFYQIDKQHILGLQYYSEEIAHRIKVLMDIE